jgi:hypothetical protein
MVVTFGGTLFFIDSSLYYLGIFSANALFFPGNFTVYYHIIFKQVTVPARRQDMVYDISRRVGLSFPLCFYLDANT